MNEMSFDGEGVGATSTHGGLPSPAVDGPPTPTNKVVGTNAASSGMVGAGANNNNNARGGSSAQPPAMTARARRRREEAVRRLVADVQSRPVKKLEGGGATGPTSSQNNDGTGPHKAAMIHPEAHEWLVATSVATALEKGLDHDLYTDLVQETKDNAGRIGQICHDHSEVFLASVAKVAALGQPAAELANGLQEGQRELEENTAGPMQSAALLWEESRQAHARAKTLYTMVAACQRVAMWIERARKQAALGRPRAALDAVDEARTALTTPLSVLFLENNHSNHHAEDEEAGAAGPQLANANNANNNTTNNNPAVSSSADAHNADSRKEIFMSLEDTPFGQRAITMLPKIENEVIMGARRGLNRWFLSLRSGGDGAKAGRSVLRKCSHSMAVGPGSLGLGGFVPPAYEWRAKTADNLISRIDQSGRIARAIRLGYWFERDGRKEADLLERTTQPGIARRSEAFAAAFGWYRCWPTSATLLVDPSEFVIEDSSSRNNLSGSRHGMGGSRHGIGGSRHGKRGGSLGFRASHRGVTSASLRDHGDKSETGKWAALLTPPILYEDAASRKEDDAKLLGMPESVHPVRRAELAFSLLGKSEEFVQYYETNRFGDTKIGSGGKGEDEKGGKTSYLSSLTGDDVSVGTDRVFFAQRLPHLCASVVGFSAVEAALELGTFADDEDDDKKDGKGGTTSTAIPTPTATATSVTVSASRFRQSSERYERSLVTELGAVLRGRAKGASLPELVRSSALMSAFRTSLRIVHPSSTTRRSDKDLLAMDVDILMTAAKVSQSEQARATLAIMVDDKKLPMPCVDNYKIQTSKDASEKENQNVVEPEEVGLPFGLDKMKIDGQYVTENFVKQQEFHTFSPSVPVVLRSIHARAIACASFALSQEESGQVFPDNKKNSGGASAGYVLDCVENFITVAAHQMKDSDNVVEEGSIEKAVQVMANILALKNCLPRLFGVVLRGMCHVGLIRSHEIDDTFNYAEKTLKNADKGCNAQIQSMSALVHEICRNKIDSHITLGLDNFQWVAKSAREKPNAYCENIIHFLKGVFSSLGPMEYASRRTLHVSCCSHIAQRLLNLLSGKPNDFIMEGLPPINRIDAFGIKNLYTDVEELIKFADQTGFNDLRDTFGEVRILTGAFLDKDFPSLLQPQNAAARRKKYTDLSLEKVFNVLDKYVPSAGFGGNFMRGGDKRSSMLMIEKNELKNLQKMVKTQMV